MRYIFFLSFAIFCLNFSAQCKSFSKQCNKTIGEGYMHTGQVSGSELSPGEKHQFLATFYENQDYRISTCSDSTMGNLHLTVRNTRRQLLYDNHSDGSVFFDFKVSATQQLIISLIASENNLNDTINEPVELKGCVSAVVGFRF